MVADGLALVHLDDGTSVPQARGALLGEIAVIRSVERTADVTAGPDGVTVYWMQADTFLDAVHRAPRCTARAEAEIERRLGR